MRRSKLLAFVAPLSLACALAACGNDTTGGTIITGGTSPTPSPGTPTPSPTPTSFNVQPCLDQAVPGTGYTVQGLLIPDTLKLDFTKDNGFPNGRRLVDPVVDISLAALFLKLSVNGPGVLAAMPLNPKGNDVPIRTVFPYFGEPQGSPPLADTSGTNFNFRTDPPSAYTRVDRMGMPAVATAVIASSVKTTYNDASPSDDETNRFLPDIRAQLSVLGNALADDWPKLGFTICATPN
jgi:hypothetical protein